MAKKNKFKVGVIGLGSIANAVYLPILAERKDVEISALMCRTEATMRIVAAKFGVRNTCSSIDELTEIGLDCAFVLTPKDTHFTYVIPLLENNIDTFCEKPMAMTLTEARRMAELAEKKSRILMIGFNRRYAPVYVKARKVFKDESPDACFLEKNRPGTEYRATFENSIHMVDLMRWYCGECREVQAHAQFDDPYYETNLTAQFKFSGGTLGLLLANRTCGQWMEKAEMYGGGKTVIVEAPERVRVFDSKEEVSVATTPLAMGWADVKENMGFRAQMASFFESVQTRKQPLTSASEALKTHVLMDRILRAASLPGL